ncbi:MAG: response regulator [Azoarcus sp.]|jgi:two-component system response regulator DctR|nr:response regulator [Azoarcus sp.]
MTTTQAYLDDDDKDICDALAWQLHTREIECTCWSKAEDFLMAWQPEWRGCIVLDIRLSGMSGLACFDALLERHCLLPVIFMTGHADVQMAVNTLKKGAFDFIEKPFNHNNLVDRILAAFEADDKRQHTLADRETVKECLNSLSRREQEVMTLILEGHYNKVIANRLAISMRTVEAHRSHIFNKMKVRSAVELAQLLAVQKD